MRLRCSRLIRSPSSRGKLRSASSFSDGCTKWRDGQLNLEALASTVIAQTPSATRLSNRELREHPDWDNHPACLASPLQVGLLAAPLTDRGGKKSGLDSPLRTTLRPNSPATTNRSWCNWRRSLPSPSRTPSSPRSAKPIDLKDEFLATLSHELRTPLNAIVGWTQLLRMEDLPGETVHGLDVIDRNVKAQTKLIEDLLDVSRITTGKMRLNRSERHPGADREGGDRRHPPVRRGQGHRDFRST